MERIQKQLWDFACQILHITFIVLYTSREGLGTAKLFVGVTRNDVTVNSKGGATRNNIE